MKKIGRFIKSRKSTYLLFAIAIALLAFSSIGGVRAALIYSETYSSRVQMFDIGVSLMENGQEVSSRDYDEYEANGDWNGGGSTGTLLQHMQDDTDGDGKDDDVKLGKAYPEVLQVRNNGSINEYVRVTIYKYWMSQDSDGTWKKNQDLSPDLIDLNLLTDGSGWHIDEESTTDERTVLYYDHLLYCEDEAEAGSAVSNPFSDTITINGKVADIVESHPSQKGSDSDVLVYAYDGARFVLEARVDAVQEHNASDAIWSAWGRQAEVGNANMHIKK